MLLIIFLVIILILFLLYNKKNKPNNIKTTIFKNKFKKIHIRQSNGYNNQLIFMYKPVINSILEFMKEINIIVSYNSNDEIQSNEILLWVGCENIPDFNHFKNKNIYTIYYNTEPDFTNPNSDEIWTYSKYLFNKYINNHKQIIRFFPIICENTNYIVPYNLKNDNNLKLVFMGNFNYRQNKKNIILKSSFMKDNLVEIYNIWNDDDYNYLISNTPNIFINLTKTGTCVLPSVRINKLLSHKAIIISEFTNDIDEKYYKDIIYFCNIDEIEKIYEKLKNKTAYELEIESNIKYKKFNNIFNSKNINNLIIQK